MSTAPRLSCLIVLSGSKDGNSAPSFIQTFTLLHSTFTVQIATPGGRPLEFVNQDDQSRRWLNDFRMKVFAIPIGLHTVDPNRYSCLILPHSPGAVHDLCENKDLGQILRHFIQEKKPICAIGMGVAGLFSAMEDSDVWSFRRCTLTAVYWRFARILGVDDDGTHRKTIPGLLVECHVALQFMMNNESHVMVSVFELARSPDFASLPVIPEDVIKDRGALYSSSDPDEVHVVVDRHLVTGQNEQSTLTAVQNLVLLCNQKQAATRKERHQ